MTSDIQGGVRFCIEFTATDMRDWEPERISRFFTGLAQVIAARGRDIPALIAQVEAARAEAVSLMGQLDVIADLPAEASADEEAPTAAPPTVGRAGSDGAARSPQGGAGQ